jgi:hypothetical protein
LENFSPNNLPNLEGNHGLEHSQQSTSASAFAKPNNGGLDPTSLLANVALAQQQAAAALIKTENMGVKSETCHVADNFMNHNEDNENDLKNSGLNDGNNGNNELENVNDEDDDDDDDDDEELDDEDEIHGMVEPGEVGPNDMGEDDQDMMNEAGISVQPEDNGTEEKPVEN